MSLAKLSIFSKIPKKIIIVFSLLLVFAISEVVFPVSAFGQNKITDAQDKKRKRLSISPSVGKTLTKAIDLINDGNHRGAITMATEILNKRKLKPYDEATIREIRASSRVSLSPPDFKNALRDYVKILAIDTFDRTRTQNIIYNVAAINFQQENYSNTIKYMKFWINNSTTEKPDAYYMLAGAYVAKEDYRSALRPAEKAVALLVKPKKSTYDLLNYVYSQSKKTTKRKKLLEKIIGFWPNVKSNWAQLSGLYAESGDEKNAYVILSLAYSVGLLTKENEIKALAAYMAQLENPYRSAILIEKEMKSGVLKRNRKNVEMLSLFWAQSRENKKAIPALEEAARLSNKGKLYYRLGQTYFADEKWKKAEASLKRAIKRGGLKAKEIGDVWLLIGSCQFNQVTSANKDKRKQAKTSFANATRYASAAKSARTWISYIKGIEKVEFAQARLEKIQASEIIKIENERAKLAKRTAKLRGDSVDEEKTSTQEE